MKNKKVLIAGGIGVVAVAILLIVGFSFMGQFQAKKILTQYFQEQQTTGEQLSIDDYKGTGVVKDEIEFQDSGVRLSDEVTMDKLYAFVPTADENKKPSFIVDVKNNKVYKKEVRKELPNHQLAFYNSLVPGRKTVVVTLETENPADYKVAYSDVELTYNPTLKAFVGDVDINTAEDLKPR